MTLQPPKTLQLPSALKPYPRGSHAAWMTRCALARGDHPGGIDWTTGELPISTFGTDAPRHFKSGPDTPTTFAQIALSTVVAGARVLGYQYPLDGEKMVDEVLYALGGVPESVGGFPGALFRKMLIDRAGSETQGLRGRYPELVTPCAEEILEILPAGLKHLLEIRYADTPGDVEKAAEAMKAAGEPPANHVVESPKGSGKTEDLLAYLPGWYEKGLVVTHRIGLTSRVRSIIDCDHYTDPRPHETLSHPGWVAYVINSFTRFRRNNEHDHHREGVECVAFDEFLGIMCAIAAGKSYWGAGGEMSHANIVFEELKSIFADPEIATFSMDANMSRKCTEFILGCGIASGKKTIVWKVRSTPESKKLAAERAVEAGWDPRSMRPNVVMYKGKVEFLDAINEAVNRDDGKTVMLGGTGAGKMEKFYKYFNPGEGEGAMLINSETNGEDATKDFFNNPNRLIEEGGYQLIVMSPSGAEGVSITTKEVSSVVYIAVPSNQSVPFWIIDQMADRVRHRVEIHIWFNRQGAPTATPTAEVVTNTLVDAVQANSWAEGPNGGRPALAKLDTFSDFQAWMMEDIEYGTNNIMQLLPIHFEAQQYDLPADAFQGEGFDVEEFFGIVDDPFKQVNEALREEMLADILYSDDIMEEEYQRLVSEGELSTMAARPLTRRRLAHRLYNTTQSAPRVRMAPPVRVVRQEDRIHLQEQQEERCRLDEERTADMIASGNAKFVPITEGLVEQARSLDYSFGKRARLRNALFHPGGAGGGAGPGRRGTAASDDTMSTGHKALIDGVVSDLGINLLTGQGTWGVEDEERVMRNPGLLGNIALALRSDLIGGKVIDPFSENLEQRAASFLKRGPDSVVKAILGRLGLGVRGLENDRRQIDQISHRFCISVIYRGGLHDNDRDPFAANAILDTMLEVINTPLPESTSLKGKTPKMLSRMIATAGGVLPLTTYSLVKVAEMMPQSPKARKKRDGTVMTDAEFKAAGKRKARGYIKAFQRDPGVLRDLGLVEWECQVVKGEGFGRGKKDPTATVLAEKEIPIDQILEKTRVMLDAESVTVVSEPPQLNDR